MIANDPLRAVSCWRACAPGEHAVSLRVAGEAVDRGLVTVVGARLRSAAKVVAGWDPWSGIGVFRGAEGLSSPTLAWRAGEGLDGVLVGEALGVAVRAGSAPLTLTLVVDGEESARELVVTVDAESAAPWVGRAARVTDATAVVRTTAGWSYARAGDGPLHTGARAAALWLRATAAGRPVTWWAHDADEARWVLRAEGDGAGARVTVACADAGELAAWAGVAGEGAGVVRSSPWADF